MSRSIVAFVVLGLALVACGREETPKTQPKIEATAITEALKGQIDAAMVAEGAKLFNQKRCSFCHKLSGETKLLGPNLAGISQRMDDASLEAWIRHPTRMKPDTKMPPFDGSDAQLLALLAWLKTI